MADIVKLWLERISLVLSILSILLGCIGYAMYKAATIQLELDNLTTDVTQISTKVDGIYDICKDKTEETK